jgi:Zn-dependent protease/CBS domain-containing protein
MRWSVRIITVRGIPIRIHISFVLVLLWAAYVGVQDAQSVGTSDIGRAIAFTVLFVVLLFGCVLLHELGHALTAQLFGVQVQDITLWPIGGVARMARMPQQSYQEFMITAAGPATNVLLALLIAVSAVIWLGPTFWLNQFSDPRRFVLLSGGWDAPELLLLLVFNNVLLAVFNLIPAFPMDGGRMLRSLLTAFLPPEHATRIASVIGQVLAALMLLIGLVTQNVALSLVALFVFVSAGQERQQTLYDVNLQGLTVRDALQPVPLALHPLQSVGDAALQATNYPGDAMLVMESGRLVGLITREDLLLLAKRAGPEARLTQIGFRPLLRLSPDDSLSSARDRLIEGSAWAAAVVVDENVVGLVSLRGIARISELLRVCPAVLRK